MQQLLIIVGLVVLAVLVWVAIQRRKAQSAEPPSGRGRGNKEPLDTLMSWHPQATRILTAPERKAYAALREGLPEHIILAQVPLARFLKVPTRHSYSEWLRRVGVLCADIVVCDSVSQVIAVVDVRQPEALENERARQRHARMDRVLKAAEIPLHVWREDALPNAVGARNAILKMPVELPAKPAAAPVATTPATAVVRPMPTRQSTPVDAREPVAFVVEDDGTEQRDPPSSTWFDDLDSGRVPLAAAPMPPRGSGPSIR